MAGAGRWAWLLSMLLALLPLVGCRQDMHDQPRHEALEASQFFADGMASRPLIEGTVARGQLPGDDLLETGRTADGEPAATFPMEVDEAMLRRGQERYEIYCSVCHGRLGDGDGMVVRRGFTEPTSFHTDDLRNRRPGHFVDVVVEGFGRMPSYRGVIEPEDRWAIAAYIRVLQISQNAELAELPAADRSAVLEGDRAAESEGGQTTDGDHASDGGH